MKKSNLIIGVLSMFLISCGGKNADKVDSMETSNSDCLCSELNLLIPNPDGSQKQNWKDIVKDDKPYTGLCVDKDQNDSILRKIEFKNGWTVREIVREKIANNYVTVSDFTYDNLKKVDGFLLLFQENEDIKYTSDYFVTKNGEVKAELGYSIIFKNTDDIYLQGEYDDFNEEYKINKLKGMSLIMSDVTLPKLKKCLTSFKFADKTVGGEKYFNEQATVETKNSLLSCMKDELPHFGYWKIK